MTPRKSLRDRNAAAIAGDRATPTTDTQPTPTTTTPQPRTTTERALIAVYMPRETYNAARAAFISDFHHGGNIDTWIDWVSTAIQTHAKRTPATRAKISPERPRSATRGVSRELRITTAAHEAMTRALAADHAHGRYTHPSGWVYDALEAATEASRQAAGGTLPEPPARLPRRLIR